MKIKIKDVVQALEAVAHPSLQESYDNSGLLTGDAETEVKKVLISLDCTEEVVKEAIQKGCNMIVSHHPIIFGGLKRLTGKTYIERTVIKALKNDIALYAGHTNFDHVLRKGVNEKFAEKLGLKNLSILSPQKNRLSKLIVFIPEDHLDNVLKAMHDAGAGSIGNYARCAYYSVGTGQFMPLEGSDPYIGKEYIPERVKEYRAEVLFPNYKAREIVAALKAAHPYEEPAYDIITLENEHEEAGAGMIGELPEAQDEHSFLKFIKEALNLQCLRHTKPTGMKVRKVALCGGSGSFLLNDALRKQADAFVTADFKYHDFFNADGKVLIADVGHYESEVWTKELFFEILSEKFRSIALVLSEVSTNPIHYL